MLYDELVPQGEYLAHYGVPKSQWSPEARARHNRNHPQKGDVPPAAYRQVYENIRGAYDEYHNNNYNRGGNRSVFGSKVDEHRAQAAEARRNRDNNRGSGYQSKPSDHQHTESYRKPRRHSQDSKAPSQYAKTPGRTNNTPSKPSSGSSSSGYNPIRARFTRRPDPSINELESERRTNASIRPNRSAGKKPSSGKSSRKTHSKNAHSGGGYSDRANTNIYDRPTGNRTRHSGNAGPGSMEQIGDNTYRRVNYEDRRRRR